MLGFGPLCEFPLCGLPLVVVPPPPTPTTGGGGGGFAQGGGKRNMPRLDELDVFCKLEKRRAGQSIIECLRELDNPEEIVEAQQVLVDAGTEIAAIRRSETELKAKEFNASIGDMRRELAALQGFLREQHEALLQRQKEEDEDDEDFLYMAGFL